LPVKKFYMGISAYSTEKRFSRLTAPLATPDCSMEEAITFPPFRSGGGEKKSTPE
jgi:hypothetical protein